MEKGKRVWGCRLNKEKMTWARNSLACTVHKGLVILSCVREYDGQLYLQAEGEGRVPVYQDQRAGPEAPVLCIPMAHSASVSGISFTR